MGFMMPCCMCGSMLTSFVQKSAFKITRQVKFNHKGEVTLDQELDSARPVCDGCVGKFEEQGHVFNWKTGTVVKHYAEDKKSALVPTPDIPLPPSKKVKKKVNVASEKRDYTTYKDVQLTYLMHGLEGLEALRKAKAVPSTVFRKGLRKLQESGRDVSDFEAWCIDSFGTGTRGRSSPKSGQNRQYRAQQVRTGEPFIRLPVSSLDIWKGMLLNVEFEDEKIVVMPARPRR